MSRRGDSVQFFKGRNSPLQGIWNVCKMADDANWRWKLLLDIKVSKGQEEGGHFGRKEG